MLISKLGEFLIIAGRGVLLSLASLLIIALGTMISMSLKWLLH